MGELLIGRAAASDELIGRLSAGAAPVVVFGEAGVGKTALVRAVLTGRGYREGGCLATLSWSPYLPLRRAFGSDLPDDAWTGDATYAADAVVTGLAGDTLFVDDVQWADRGTLRVLDMLAGTVPMVLAVRRGDPAAAGVLDRLRITPAERIDLEPLEGDDAAELVRTLRPRMASAEVMDLVARSGGNPLLIEELADADRSTESLQLAVLARCRELPDEELDGLSLLSVAGRPLPVEDVPGAAGLVDAGLAGTTSGSVAIRHTLIREVIGELISEERRVRCHLQLAGLVTHPGEAATHLLEAGEKEQAYHAAMRAVEQAPTPGERVAHLQIAARCVDPEPGAELRLLAAESATEVDESGTAAALLDGLPDRPDLRFRVARQRAVIAYFEGDSDAHRAALADQMAAARPGTVEEVLTLAERSFVALVVDGDLPAGVALARQARALSEEIGEGRVAALKAFADACYLDFDDRWRDAMPAALREARHQGDFAREWRIANNYVTALEVFGPQSDARSLAREMRERCAELRLRELELNFEFRELNLAAHASDYDAVLERAPVMLAAGGSAEQYVVDLSFTLAIAQFDSGHFGDAMATIEGMLARGSDRGRASYHLARAWGFLEVGRPDLAHAEEAPFRANEVDESRLTIATPGFAWAAFEAGAPEPPPPPTSPDYGILAGVAPELAGIAALRVGDPAAAAQHFGRAADLYRDFHRRAAVRCAWARGEALRLAGAPSAAAVLAEVESTARHHRQLGVVTRCERSLRSLGVRRSAAIARAGDSPLTAREHEIVLLAADGLTDRAIAARLGIAHRTVQTLLANARRKVGAENRRHLIGIVTGAGG